MFPSLKTPPNSILWDLPGPSKIDLNYLFHRRGTNLFDRSSIGSELHGNINLNHNRPFHEINYHYSHVYQYPIKIDFLQGCSLQHLRNEEFGSMLWGPAQPTTSSLEGP